MISRSGTRLDGNGQEDFMMLKESETMRFRQFQMSLIQAEESRIAQARKLQQQQNTDFETQRMQPVTAAGGATITPATTARSSSPSQAHPHPHHVAGMNPISVTREVSSSPTTAMLRSGAGARSAILRTPPPPLPPPPPMPTASQR